MKISIKINYACGCIEMKEVEIGGFPEQTKNIINNILTDEQLDIRTACGKTIREWNESFNFTPEVQLDGCADCVRFGAYEEGQHAHDTD